MFSFDFSLYINQSNTWFFQILFYDYFYFYTQIFKTDLNIFREIYFFNNCLEFLLINFILLYSIFIVITLFFFIKKIFVYLNFYNFYFLFWQKEINFFFIIKNQNLINQHLTKSGSRVWKKQNLLKKK